MKFDVQCEIAAPVEAVWAWWTDFGEPGASFRMKHGPGSSTRKILSREGRVVVMEDRSVLGRVRRTLTLGDHQMHEVGEGGQRFESFWRFDVAGPSRTRVVRTMRVRASPVFGPFARWVASTDLRYHCREAEKDLAATR